MKYLEKGVLVVFFMFVIISIPSVESSWIDSGTSYSSGGLGCAVENDYAAWVEVSGDSESIKELVFNASGPVGNCSLHYVDTNKTCCPSGYRCDLGTGNCERENVNYCADFKTQASCNAAREEGERTVMENFPEDYLDLCFLETAAWEISAGKYCSNQTSCGCEWDDVDKECDAFNRKFQVCATDTNREETLLGKCIIRLESKENLCDKPERIIRVTYTSTRVDDSDPGFTCTDPSPKEYSCDNVTVVPFFDWTNFLISILGIGTIYLFFLKKS